MAGKTKKDMFKRELDSLRKEIDLLDCSLIYILAERFNLVRKIGSIKLKMGKSKYSPGRMKKMIKQRELLADKINLTHARSFIKDIFKLIIKYSMKEEKN